MGMWCTIAQACCSTEQCTGVGSRVGDDGVDWAGFTALHQLVYCRALATVRLPCHGAPIDQRV